MAIEVKLPELGPGIESGDVLEVLVSEGDTIAAGQDVIEMETDKATVPVPSSSAGKVVKIHVQVGTTLAVGGVILEVEAASGAEADKPADAAPAAPQQPAPTAPAPSTPAAKSADAEQSKPTEATPQPVVTPPAAPAPPAQPATMQSAPAIKTSAPVEARPAAVVDSDDAASGEVIPAGPAIRRFAREVGVDLARVQGTGEGGRISREDILEVVRKANQVAATGTKALSTAGGNVAAPSSQPATKSATTSSSPALPGTADTDDYGPVRIERMSKIRKTIANQMHLSWSTVPRVTNFDDADITDLERLRSSSKDDYAAQGIKLTTMPFLIKAVATALRHHPGVNAIIDQEKEQIIYKDYVNVGVAVDTDRGLVVPVMHNTDKMGIPDIARGLAQMAANVRSGQFAISDLRGGTFTISNLGAIGGQYSTPIVNVPEVAILLVGRSRKLPVVMPDDSIQARLMMPLSLSYDHRLVDGGTAARFLNDVIGFLEAPSRLLLAL